ncbi:hypothetical protein NL676_039854 [Syzygium grande]|nr:hypothetical protein NL676_039854 [Syzygium grande]
MGGNLTKEEAAADDRVEEDVKTAIGTGATKEKAVGRGDRMEEEEEVAAATWTGTMRLGGLESMTINKWKKALQSVSRIQGCELEKFQNRAYDAVDEITAAFSIAFNPVGTIFLSSNSCDTEAFLREVESTEKDEEERLEQS